MNMLEREPRNIEKGITNVEGKLHHSIFVFKGLDISRFGVARPHAHQPWDPAVW